MLYESYWFYTANIQGTEEVFEFSKTVGSYDNFFPIGTEIKNICENAEVSITDLSFKLVVQISFKEFIIMNELTDTEK